MKPNIDLSNPIIVKIIDEYRTTMAKALGVAQKVESAVYPIYSLDQKRNKPIQTGSGVLVNIKNEYFIFSASHVFDDIREYQMLTGDGTGSKILSLEGDRYSTGRGKTGTHTDDPIDASVFHIKSQIPDNMKRDAISLKDFDLDKDETNNKSVYIAAGFRVKKSNTAGNEIRSKREGYPSIQITEKDYKRKGINPQFSIALHYEDQILVDGRWQISSTPKGFSGGAIIRIEGVELLGKKYNEFQCRQLLSGIIIEQRRRKNQEEGVLIGTRIDIHVELIKHFLPNILEDR